MKFPYVVFLVAMISFVALGVVSVLLDFSIRDLQTDVAMREQELQTADQHLAELTQARQTLEQKLEAQEVANESLRKRAAQQQLVVQTQQEQINRGTQLAQQIAPNLLHDLAMASLKNEKLRTLLAHHGYSLQVGTPAPTK